MSASQEIRYTSHEGFSRLALNLGRTNTLDSDAIEAINETLNRSAADPGLRFLVITGNETGYFSSGLGPSLFLDRTEAEIRSVMTQILRMAEGILFFPAPVISLLNGHALGAGAVLALCSDIRIMEAKKARIGFPEAAIRVYFPALLAKLLQDLVGMTGARDLLFDARNLKGEEALSLGLVDEIHQAEELEGKAREYMERHRRISTEGLRFTKHSLRNHYRSLVRELFQEDLEKSVQLLLSPETQSSFRAMAEREKEK